MRRLALLTGAACVDLTGGRAVVTGSSSGTGRWTSRALASAGAEVTCRTGRDHVVTDELDGLTVSAPDWWFNLRPSNTEPLLRLNVEASDADAVARLRDEVLAIVGRGRCVGGAVRGR